MLRRKLETAVFIAAALASIATSPKRWMIEAQNVPAIPDPTKTTRVVVHAPTMPTLDLVKRGGKEFQSSRLAPIGNDDYEALVPPDWGIYKAYVSGRCKGGMFCMAEECEPPGWEVSVKPMTSVSTWRLEIASKPMTTFLDAKMFDTTTTMKLDATRPVNIKVTMTSGPDPIANADASSAALYWRGVPTSITATWTAQLWFEGPCPTTEPCKPPATEHLIVVSTETKADAPKE